MPGEPLWLDEDRRKVMEWQADRRDHCGTCGQRQSEWRDENGVELLNPPFELVKSVCPACAWLEQDREEMQKERQGRPGLKFGFRRVQEDPGVSDEDSLVEG